MYENEILEFAALGLKLYYSCVSGLKISAKKCIKVIKI